MSAAAVHLFSALRSLRERLDLPVEAGHVYYVGSSETLPPPLTAAEESSLLEVLPTGDARVRSVLIERNLRLVVYIARKFENTGIHI